MAGVTDGTLVVDVWYYPISDDGALVGDDHDVDLDDYISAAVWAAVSRTLTAGTNLNIPDAAAIRSAVGLASANLDTQLGNIPTLAELQSEIDDVQADIAGLNDPDATAIATAVWGAANRTLSALGFQLAASDLAADTIGASELADDAIAAIVSGVWTTALTESYAEAGSEPTGAEALFAIMQRLVEFAISGTTITVKKLDGSTSAYTLTLDDANAPTSSTRAT